MHDPDLPPFEVLRRSPGAVDLFAYAAAVGNAHRIHYDHRYATGTEGHPDVVVPGPLQASYICQVLRTWMARASLDGRIASLRYRHRKPVHVDDQLEIGAEVESVDRQAGRIVCRVWTRLAGDEAPATEGEAVLETAVG